MALAVAALGLALAISLTATPQRQALLATQIEQALAQSGVENPVTAVLLNFRVFDTMLELAVLLLVAVTLGFLRAAIAPAEHMTASERVTAPLLDALVEDIVPLLILAGGYLLWVGAYAPGGAFQAGAVLAGAMVLARLSGHARAWPFTSVAARALLAMGTAVFVLAALGLQVGSGGYFQYPQEQAGGWILALETAATVSIAATLYAIFLALAPGQAGDA